MWAAPPLLWDGGLGSGLLARGLDLTAGPPEMWLETHPAQVRALHEEFVAAGVDVLQTNTFNLLRLYVGASPLPAAQIGSMAAAAVALAREAAAGAGVRVVASLGPSGQPQPDPARVEAACAELAAALVQAGAEAVHLETAWHPQELTAALRGARAGAAGRPVLASLTLSLGHTGLETPLGIPLASMLRAMDREPPDGVGLNCSQNARRMLPAVERLAQWASGHLPLLAQPQVDPPGLDCKGRTRPEPAEQFVHDLLRLVEAGATAIGGCCGCTAAHLAAVRHALGPRQDPPRG
ncbi:MAG: homocysteine S-methyltransferase family protein [Myxococcota bacterium]|nr:homocysteine S-methyltransferase family protein [Myxococcota bacterium]